MKEDERILNAITPIVNARKTHKDDNLYSLQLNSYQLDMLQGLLDLYEKEKLNNFSLSDKLNKEKEKNKKLEDKIKGKIKELNELLKETQKELGSASIEFNIYAHQKDILNCLLEE